MRKKNKIDTLDDNFLKNFANPENLLVNQPQQPAPEATQVREGSASVEKWKAQMIQIILIYWISIWQN